MDTDRIATPPAGLTEALTLATAVDEALMHGLSRLPESVGESLDTLGGTLSGSPLAVVVAEAVEQVKRSEFSVSACLGLAAGRSALLGAAADALRAQLYPEGASGTAVEEEAPAFSAGNHAPLLSGVRQWLTELVVAGFAQLAEAQLTPFARVLTQLQAVEELAGQAALLPGFLDELILSNQQKEREGLPTRRWADLLVRRHAGGAGAGSGTGVSALG